ncbi:aldo/keto reductase [Gracilibacillus sp. YIM 98692]|uniref:aldo/keto reductase n=1 Tax=Gracilibacillus sp. YIM 98692 TaxID=2663532 RepID=UPI0013D2E0E8|nr:aldo/keto reductase [Gracilibacillus sp. YIM 98692]
MEKRRLGNSNLMVSVLGMGCWQYGGGTYWGDQSQNDVNTIVGEALDLGINYFDTAEVYNNGESEKSLGIALKNKREQAIIGTKFNPAQAYPSSIKKACENSLKRLQTDYIDLYMLHWPIHSHSIRHFTDDEEIINTSPNIQLAFETLNQLRKEGKIRYIGISNHGINQMQEVRSTNIPFLCNELPYNLFSRGIEKDILPNCEENNVGVIGYMPLQQGLLTGKYKNLDEVKPMQARSRHFHYLRGEGTRHREKGAEEEITRALPEIQDIANELGVHIIELALAWTISDQRISTVVAGSRTKKHLDLNVQAAYLKLDDKIIQRLNEITKPILDKLGSNPDYYETRVNSRIF